MGGVIFRTKGDPSQSSNFDAQSMSYSALWWGHDWKRFHTMGVGVIAQEVMKLLPSTVSTFRAKLDQSDTEETELYRFDATEITWALVNAVKELNSRLSVAEARLV